MRSSLAASEDGSAARIRSSLVVALLLALLPGLLEVIVSTDMSGPKGASDGAFTITALNGFIDALRHGSYFPRWSWPGNDGLGSPLFLFYPPAAYWIAAATAALQPADSLTAAVGICELIFRVGAIATCVWWLRPKTGLFWALLAACLYVSFPYTAYYNPVYRMAFGETGASMVIPLVLVAIDRTLSSGLRAKLCGVSLSIFVVSIFHLPSAVILGGLGPVYAAMSVPRERSLMVFVQVGLGVCFGLALAAALYVPALALLNDISSTSLYDGANFHWYGNFLMKPRGFLDSYFALLDFCMAVPCLVGILAFRKAWPGPGFNRALAALFGLSVFLCLPLSWPVWKIVIPLQSIQLPWRFLQVISLAAAAIAGQRGGAENNRRSTLAALGLLTALSLLDCGAVWYSRARLSPADRDQGALSSTFRDAPEFIPAPARDAGWKDFVFTPNYRADRVSRVVPDCITGRTRTGPAEQVTLNACPAVMVLPVFYFPGWSVRDAAGASLGAPFPVEGLLAVNLPPSTKSITLSRVATMPERIGWTASGCAAAIWLALFGSLQWRPIKPIRRTG